MLWFISFLWVHMIKDTLSEIILYSAPVDTAECGLIWALKAYRCNTAVLLKSVNCYMKFSAVNCVFSYIHYQNDALK